MTIETATFLAALDATKPLNTDLVAEGDDHLRLLKAVLQATFPGRGVGEKAPLSRIVPFAPGLSEISALFVANGATQADLPAVSGLPGGTHYWFWAADNDLLLTTLDTALINGGATLTLEQGTGACVFCTGSGWAAIGLGGGSGPEAVNLIEGANIDISGTYPDLTVAVTGIPITHALATVLQSSAIDIPTGTAARIPLDLVSIDIQNDFDTGVYKFLVSQPGVYRIEVKCNVYSLSDITRTVLLSIGQGTIGLLHATCQSGLTSFISTDVHTYQISCLVSLALDDLVDVQIVANATGLKASLCNFRIEYVHPEP